MPPASCIAPAAVTTVMMISIALTGTLPGAILNSSTKASTPTAPNRPMAMPL